MFFIRYPITVFLLLLLGACASMNSKPAPQFYPNDHLSKVGPTQASIDTQECERMADQFVQDPEKWKGVLKSTGESAIVGTATGAVGGAIVSNAGRGAGIGAATGAMLGLYNGLKKAGEPNPSHQRFVEHCLSEKGYKVYGWN